MAVRVVAAHRWPRHIGEVAAKRLPHQPQGRSIVAFSAAFPAQARQPPAQTQGAEPLTERLFTKPQQPRNFAALEAGVTAATDVTGFGLLGHLYKMCRASGVTARIDAAAVPYIDGARQALAAGQVPGGSRRNLDWVRPHLAADAVSEEELILLADAQTSGGLLVVGEVPGAPVVGHTLAAGELGDGILLEVV